LIANLLNGRCSLQKMLQQSVLLKTGCVSSRMSKQFSMENLQRGNQFHFYEYRFIKHKQTEQWIGKRRTYVNEGEEANRKHIEFAKNLFISWDDDGSGLLEPHEIIKPLIGMGLSSDHNFAKKII